MTIDEAAAIARRDGPGRAAVSVSVPDAKDKTSTYFAYLAAATTRTTTASTRATSASPSTATAARRRSPTRPGEPAARPTQLVDDWFYPLHAGTFVNGWWRRPGWSFGLTPLLLAVTGVTTWLIRRRKRRRKRQRFAPAPA